MPRTSNKNTDKVEPSIETVSKLVDELDENQPQKEVEVKELTNEELIEEKQPKVDVVTVVPEVVAPIETPVDLYMEKRKVPTIKEVEVVKPLDVVNIEDAKTKIPDIKIVGNGDSFQLLCKASSKEGKWMKSTKGYEIPGAGVIVQTTTQQGDNVAEALIFIGCVKIVDDVNGGKKLVKAP